MRSLREVIAEALNTAYKDPGDEFDSLRESYRHDGHQFNGACYVCQGDVEQMTEAVRTALMANEWLRLVLITKFQSIADQYPAEVFTPDGKTPDGIAGTAIRERMLGEIRMLREAAGEASSPSGHAGSTTP